MSAKPSANTLSKVDDFMQFNNVSKDTSKVTTELLTETERESLDSTAQVVKAQAEWREKYF